MSTLSVWLAAARPKTLPAACAPVALGTAIAFHDNALHAPAAACALLGALLIQIGTNYANDYFDYLKGADTADRKGPLRATQAGLVAPAAMRRAFVLVFLAALGPGAYLVWRGGWPFVAIGVVSILCGVFYTAGPRPLGYIGLGDVFVLVFFGPVAVAGTHYAQALAFSADAVVAGLGPGLLSTALLTVNNLRDVDEDRIAGKRTLAVRFGRLFARLEYLGCLLGACLALPLYFYATTQRRAFMIAPLVSLIVAAPLARSVFRAADAARLNRTLAGTGLLLVVFTGLFVLGWLR